MIVTLVDSSIMLDLLSDGSAWRDWTEKALARALDDGDVAINPIIYAELAPGFLTEESLEAAIPPFVRRLHLPWEAAFLAGKAFVDYRRRGGPRTAPLPDFYIGAHAAISGLTLLTRDATRYRTYFPRLQLIAPN